MDRFNVLFVDDETNILNSINRITIQEDFKSLFAGSGEKALEQFEENEIAVIVTDMRMPKMNGLELLEKVKEISPNTVRMVLSGYAQISQVIATVNKVGVFKYITKPWNNEEEFLPAIREALKYYNLVKENEIFKVQIEEKNKLYKKILDSNNNLVKNSQKDINYIKVVSKIIFDLKNSMYDSLNNECSKQKHISELIDKVYFQYLETVPSISETFNLTSLQPRFDELKSRKLPIIYDNNNTAQINYLGNKRVFELIFNNVLEVITWDSKEEELLLNFMHNSTLNINFFIRNKNNFIKTISKPEAKLILNFLDGLSKIFGGKITIVPDKFLININTGLKIAD
ncbi:response regulator [Clostridium beijerinckii]|uniref:Stage 0 sporulation protein A homolog n=1 Tax=Clostridium beijerinckii TaxID=1520 RepID=A0A1S8S2L1_CLOBE|nr:response regulator [Clostridium beijerinckii]NRU39006.1 YesN/AraC family two-component response regulator [Clostridium beijerinckii]NRY63736.1 YesN/AraC family two-component response regulator [Clostridium beijerinckii]NSA97715.1 YesN/AraC family two-component response regulator [Clostridium beijerinckii]OOM59505.1 hydrogenase transcriptional regulatory protein hupR1 [Clostridium beijerinckii]OOM64524.1 hydrogenase transcriptional regulatory protein hupR1 [Clostridium beijerinckii]